MSPSPKRKPHTVICPVCGLELPARLKMCPQDGVELTASVPFDPLVGTVIGGRYEVMSVVGRGGMSVVYKARNRAVGSIVAIKTLKEDMVQDEELFARFCQEAKAVQMLTHPHIITVHEFGVTLNGQPFIVMDFLDGSTLADVLEESGRIPVKRMLKISIQVCEALGHAHAHKIIHRDIKPGNIMLVTLGNESDFVKLFDFGFAKLLPRRGIAAQSLTQQGDVLGTPLYMSPEQSRGKDLDSRTDIYSLGCVLYEAVTGMAPIVGDNVLDTMQRQINEMPAALESARPDLYIPDALTSVIFKMLAKNRDERYQSVNDVKRDLEFIVGVGTGSSSRLTGSAPLPGLAKLKRLPEEKSNHAGSWLRVMVALVVASCVAAFATRYFQHTGTTPASQGLSTKDSKPLNHEGGQPSAATTDDPREAWMNFRQKGLKALEAGDYSLAESMFGLAFDQAGKLVNFDQSRAIVYLDMAHVFLKESRFADAEQAATKSMGLYAKLNQNNERPMADVRLCLSQISIARQDYKSAQADLARALAIQVRVLGANNEEVGTTFAEMGRVAEAERNYQMALNYYKQALSIRQAALGPNKTPVAETLFNLARVLKRLHRYDDARRAVLQARAISNGNARRN